MTDSPSGSGPRPSRDDGLFTAASRRPSPAQDADLHPADGPSDEARDAQRDAVDLTERVEGRDDEGGDSLGSFLKELPILLLIAFGLAFLLRTFVVQVFYIPSESMVPTLEINDRIVVEKISYHFRDPERGEVVVFAGESPFGSTQDSGIQKVVRGVGQFLGVVPVDARDLVKRIIGLPGDDVVIDNGVVSVNGKTLDEPYARLDNDDGTYHVPEGSLFVMGDNRARSADSRSSLGFVPIKDIVGRAVLKIWPLDRFGSVEGVQQDVPPPTGDAVAPLPERAPPAAVAAG